MTESASPTHKKGLASNAGKRPRTGRRSSSEEAPDPLLQKLKSEPRRHDWFPIFARNLGDMARRLEPNKQKAAARRMFDEAFGQSAEANWRKRKRYIRFEGEESEFTGYGEYMSRVEPYIGLSGAFAKLALTTEGDGVKRALRMLVRGTSLDPRPERDLSAADGLEQATRCLKLIEDVCRGDATIAEAMTHLSKYPVGLSEGRTAPNNVQLRERGGACYPWQQKAIAPVATSTIDACRDQHPLDRWFVGRLLIGYLYLPRDIAVVPLRMTAEDCMKRIHAAVRSGLHRYKKRTGVRSKRTKQATAHRDLERQRIDKLSSDEFCKIIEERLEQLGVTEFWPGDEHFEGSEIPEVLNRTIHIRKAVHVLLDYGEGGARVLLDVSGERTGLGDSEDDLEVFTRGATADGDKLMTWVTDIPGQLVQVLDEENDEMFDWITRLLEVDGSAYVVGGNSIRTYETRSYRVSPDEVEIKEVLVEGADKKHSIFQPVIWDDLGRLSAAPHGSIAGSILRNFTYASDEVRIDTLLHGDAIRRIAGVVEVVRQELEKSAVALGARGVEFD